MKPGTPSEQRGTREVSDAEPHANASLLDHANVMLRSVPLSAVPWAGKRAGLRMLAGRDGVSRLLYPRCAQHNTAGASHTNLLLPDIGKINKTAHFPFRPECFTVANVTFI